MFQLGGQLFNWAYDPAPETLGVPMGTGSVAHIARASKDDDHLEWQRRLREAGVDVTEAKNRDYFGSIYRSSQREFGIAAFGHGDPVVGRAAALLHAGRV